MSVEYLGARWAEVRAAGLWNLLFIPIMCLPFVGSGLLIRQGVDLLRADIAGSVTIASCESTKAGWNCDGPSTAADGSVRVDRVRLYPYFAQVDQPAGTVVARVSGPDATQADRGNKAFPVPLWA